MSMDSDTKKAFAWFLVFILGMMGIFLFFVYAILSLFPQALL